MSGVWSVGFYDYLLLFLYAGSHPSYFKLLVAFAWDKGPTLPFCHNNQFSNVFILCKNTEAQYIPHMSLEHALLSTRFLQTCRQ